MKFLRSLSENELLFILIVGLTSSFTSTYVAVLGGSESESVSSCFSTIFSGSAYFGFTSSITYSSV
jgi:hypothetical protein